MNLAVSLAAIGANLCQMALLAYMLYRMIALTNEARVARIMAQDAARRAEGAAMLAASHALEAATTIVAVAANVQKIELATNSMKDALVASTAKASHLEGRAEAEAEAEAKKP